jgi:hypothetical protein
MLGQKIRLKDFWNIEDPVEDRRSCITRYNRDERARAQQVHRSINAARMRQLVTIGTSALLAIHVVYPAFLSPLSQVQVWLVLV